MHTHPPPFDLDRRPRQMARKAELGNQASAGDAQPIFWRTGNFVLGLQPDYPEESISSSKAAKIESNFDFKGGNLDALLNQALQGKDRILGSHQKKCCKNCNTKDQELYNAKCDCSNVNWNLLCKKCLLSSSVSSSHCEKCNKQLTKKDFHRFHSDYEGRGGRKN